MEDYSRLTGAEAHSKTSPGEEAHSKTSPYYKWFLCAVFIVFNSKEKVLVVVSLNEVVTGLISRDLFNHRMSNAVNFHSHEKITELKGWCALEFYTSETDYVTENLGSSDECRSSCLQDWSCQGFQFTDTHCVKWKTPCLGSKSVGWHADTAASTMVVTAVNTLNGRVSGPYTVLTNLGQAWDDACYRCVGLMCLGLLVQALLSLDMVYTFLLVGTKHSFGTYQYMWEIVAVKKSSRCQGFFWYSAFLCLFYFCALVYLTAKGFTEWNWSQLLSPVVAVMNAWDIRKVNYNLYPGEPDADEDAFLKMNLSLAFCAAEEVLVFVENAALASDALDEQRKKNVAKADNVEAQQFRPYDPGWLIDQVVYDPADMSLIKKALKTMGKKSKGFDIIEGSDTKDMEFALLWKRVFSLWQLKPYLLVCYGSWDLIGTARATIIPYGRPSMRNNFIDQWVLLFKMFVVIFFGACFKNIVSDNKYTYGTLQYYWQIVQLKRTRPFFRFFYVFIAGYMTFLWLALGISNLYIMGGYSLTASAWWTYYGATIQPLLLIVVNAVQTRRVAPSLYPIEVQSDEIYLKLVAFGSMLSDRRISDVFSTAEEILERLENGYIVHHFSNDPKDSKYLAGVLNIKKYGESVANIYHKFGEPKTDEETSDIQAEEGLVAVILTASIFTLVIAFCWELLLPAVVGARYPPATAQDQFSPDPAPYMQGDREDNSCLPFWFSIIWVLPCGCCIGLCCGGCIRSMLAAR